MPVQLMLRLDPADWVLVKDGDPSVRTVFDRHYSRTRYADGRKPKLFVGPGQKMVLRTPEGDAIFVWRKFISQDNQDGVNCAVFRNEGPTRSSDLIVSAVRVAKTRWPDERFYTYVNPGRIRSPNPGYCFKQAGWRRCGETKRGLHILELLPDGH